MAKKYVDVRYEDEVTLDLSDRPDGKYECPSCGSNDVKLDAGGACEAGVDLYFFPNTTAVKASPYSECVRVDWCGYIQCEECGEGCDRAEEWRSK